MITYIQAEDWCALYGPDGQLLEQNHSISGPRMLKLLGIEYRHFEAEPPEDVGMFPDTLEDVQT